MILKYRKFSSPAPFSKKRNLLRPIIPISLSFNNLHLRFEALVDSGADFSIFPLGIAKRLKVDLGKSKKIYFSSATGDTVEGSVSNIFLDIDGGSLKSKVVFANLPGNIGILGQYGFFDKFIVKFDLKKEEMEIKERI